MHLLRQLSNPSGGLEQLISETIDGAEDL